MAVKRIERKKERKKKTEMKIAFSSFVCIISYVNAFYACCLLLLPFAFSFSFSF